MRTRPFPYLVVPARQVSRSHQPLQMKVTEALPNGELKACRSVLYLTIVPPDSGMSS